MPDRLICVLTGGPLYRIALGAETILFEMHHYCGPMPLNKKTHEERKLGPKHKFWRAASLWAQQGQRVGRTIRDVRLCVWDDVADKEES